MKQIVPVLFLGISVASPLLADDFSATTSTNRPAVVASTNAAPSPFGNELERASYALGMMISHNWQQQGVEVDLEWFTRGFKDLQGGGQTLLTPQQMGEALNEYKKVVQERQQKLREELAAKNKAEGAAFLAKNKSKPGVKTLKDGVQYKVLTEGKGARPGSNDVVVLNYLGKLIDGTEFESTAKFGHPIQVPLNAPSIPAGIREILSMMPTGSVWEVYLPSDLAFKEAGRPPTIPVNATLVYNLQLISFGPPNSSPMNALTNSNPPLTSDIIAVPSAEEMKKGKQPYTLKPEDVQKLQKQMQKTNSAPSK